MKRTVILLTMGAAAFAQNWPAFRGPMASGISDGMGAPVKWDAEKGTNVAWKTPIAGISVSSPVIWGDKVFLVTSVSSNPKSEFRSGLYGDTVATNPVGEVLMGTPAITKGMIVVRGMKNIYGIAGQ